MPKIEMEVKRLRDNSTFKEVYTIGEHENPMEWATETIKEFNRTLRPYESGRELVSVKVIALNESHYEHDWEKTNFVTVLKRGGGHHDTYKCSKCGITGKRHGLSDVIERDYRYRHVRFTKCNQ